MKAMRWDAKRQVTTLLVVCSLAVLGSACAPVAVAPATAASADQGAHTAHFADPSTGASDTTSSELQARTKKSALHLTMPVAGVRVGNLTSNFGAMRGARMHEGMDIFASAGTPVYSSGGGTVYYLGYTELGGWTVWVEDGPWDYWYTHLEGIAPGLSEKSRVTTDTLIGWVGNTGNASGGPPHLHFEVVTAHGPVDPLPYLVDRPGPTASAK